MRRISCALALALVACAPAATVTKPDAAPASPSGPAPSLYLPLAVGSEWTYEAKAMGTSSRDTIRIVGRDGPWFVDDHRGRLRQEQDGVRDSQRYLLRAPLVTGKTWTAVENLVVQRFEIVSTDHTVEVPAGRYTGVVVVRHEQPLQNGARFRTEWSYAPGVGLVQIRSVTLMAGREHEQSALRLVSFKRGT